ncbi:MAG: IS66 family transposase [Pseudomonadales bacterium]|nr:IS66 family transposase [Pseudomonadales bacterium]
MLFALAEVAKLEEEKRLARAERFAASSEEHPQYALFNEAEQEAVAELNESVAAEITVPAHTRKAPKRKPLPADLPRVVVEHDLDNKACDCGADKVRIGTKTSEQLDVIPAQVFVIEHQRHSYKCPCCEDAAPETAPMPAQAIPKSMASPGLLAHVAVAKYDDGLPLYRQTKQFERLGIELPRQTLASYMVKCGELITPLIERMALHARTYDVMQMDETRVQVLDEENRRAKSQSWMWVMRGGPPDQPVIHYAYDPSRAGSVAVDLLPDYRGYLQTDGYKGYAKVLSQPEITGLGCWAHARRKFIKAQQAAPKGKPSGKTQQILAWIGKLYALEKRLAEVDPETRQAQRMSEAKPILDQIEQWMGKQSINPQSLLGKAISYLQSEWPRLIIYLQDGRLNIDNNLVENAIRPFALGRKNWLFSQSIEGAKASAALYSLIETARANGLNTYTYLKHVFTELPGAMARDESLDELMPWNIDPMLLEKYLVSGTAAK